MLAIPAALAVMLGAQTVRVQQAGPGDRFSFVVLGHVRGDEGRLSDKLPEVLARVKALHPAFAVLTGDQIWGDVNTRPTDPASLERQWNELDSALATLGIPIYRTPGNHDINDVTSRDLYERRYGRLPMTVMQGRTRLILVRSAWRPADGDTTKHRFIRGLDLDSAQVDYLRTELAKREGIDHSFVFMHHLLWWETDGEPWWRDVHPLLAKAGVDAVFSGDYGPLKFSTKTKDGVRYFQSSIETHIGADMLRGRFSSRLLSSQFDCFLEVQVDGPRVDVVVHPVAEISGKEFTPERWREINEYVPPPAPALRRLWDFIGSPRRIALALAGLAVVFGAGMWVGAARRRRA